MVSKEQKIIIFLDGLQEQNDIYKESLDLLGKAKTPIENLMAQKVHSQVLASIWLLSYLLLKETS